MAPRYSKRLFNLPEFDMSFDKFETLRDRGVFRDCGETSRDEPLWLLLGGVNLLVALGLMDGAAAGKGDDLDTGVTFERTETVGDGILGGGGCEAETDGTAGITEPVDLMTLLVRVSDLGGTSSQTSACLDNSSMTIVNSRCNISS